MNALRLLLSVSLAWAFPAQVLANNLRRAPSAPTTLPGGLFVPMAQDGTPLDLVPLDAPTEPLRLSPGTVEFPAAVLPAAAAAVANSLAPAARADETPPVPLEKPALAAAETLAETASQDAPAAEQEAALTLAFDNGAPAGRAAVDVSGLAPGAAVLEPVGRGVEMSAAAVAVPGPDLEFRRKQAEDASGRRLVLIGFMGSAVLSLFLMVNMPDGTSASWMPLAPLAAAAPALLAFAAVDRAARWLEARRAEPGRPLQFSLTSLLVSMLLVAALTQSVVNYRRAGELIARAPIAESAEESLRLPARADGFEAFLRSLNRMNPDPDPAGLWPFIVRAPLAPEPYWLDAFAESSYPWTDDELERFHKDLKYNWGGGVTREQLRFLAAVHEIWLETQHDPSLRERPRELHRRYVQAHRALGWSEQEVAAEQARADGLFRRMDAARSLTWNMASLFALSAALAFGLFGRLWRKMRPWLGRAAGAAAGLLLMPSLLLAGDGGGDWAERSPLLLLAAAPVMFLAALRPGENAWARRIMLGIATMVSAAIGLSWTAGDLATPVAIALAFLAVLWAARGLLALALAGKGSRPRFRLRTLGAAVVSAALAVQGGNLLFRSIPRAEALHARQRTAWMDLREIDLYRSAVEDPVIESPGGTVIIPHPFGAFVHYNFLMLRRDLERSLSQEDHDAFSRVERLSPLFKGQDRPWDRSAVEHAWERTRSEPLPPSMAELELAAELHRIWLDGLRRRETEPQELHARFAQAVAGSRPTLGDAEALGGRLRFEFAHAGQAEKYSRDILREAALLSAAVALLWLWTAWRAGTPPLARRDQR